MSRSPRSLFKHPLLGPVSLTLFLFALFWIPYLARASATVPDTPADSAETVEVRITTEGFEPAVVTLRAGDEVRWINETNQTVTLIEGESLPQLFLPLIRKSGSTTEVAVAGAASEASARPTNGLFSQTIAPGASFTFQFEQVADYRLRVFPFNFFGRVTLVPPSGGRVHGRIYTDLRNRNDNQEEESPQIFLPEVTVRLEDSSGATTARVLTDLSGRFAFPHQKAGNYTLCWEAEGFIDDCQTSPVSVGSGNMDVGHVPIFLEQRDGFTTIYGKVRLHDHSLPRFFEPFANVNVFAQVRLLDEPQEKELDRVYVNNFGDYLLPQVSVRASRYVEALMEDAAGSRLLLQGKLPPHSASRVDIYLPNSRPVVDSVMAYDNGDSIQVAEPGQEVTLQALFDDPDGDTVHYRWILHNNGGSLSSDDGSSVQWKLPEYEAMNQVDVIAYDGRGGYNRASLLLETTEKGVRFSGRVVDPNGNPVANALVSVNGNNIVANANGYAQLRVPQAARYVLNIHADGYALMSRIYPRAQAGDLWTLTPATVLTVDPTQPINEQDLERICPGPDSDRIDWRRFPDRQQPRYQDGSGEVISVGGRAIRFEDLTAKTGYNVGDQFVDGGQRGTVSTFYFSDGTPYDLGRALVDTGGNAGGSGNEMFVANVNIAFTPTVPVHEMTIQFGEYGGNINLTINGEMANKADFADLDDTTLGGVAIMAGSFNNQGSIHLYGPIRSFAIGGQELFVDNIIFDPPAETFVERWCPPGLSVEIPPNSLVDENGDPPPGNVQLSLGTYDILSPSGLPGDYTAENSSGQTRVMESFGSGAIEISDGSTSYNLRPGAAATLTMPVETAHYSFGRPIPPTIPNLVYNEETGIWEEIGTWTLDGDHYVTQVPHFSAFNTDLLKQDQACVRMETDGITGNFRVEITIPQGPNAAPKIVSGVLDNSDPYHVVYNLPTNTNITVVAIRLNEDIPIGTYVVNTGGPQNPTDPNLPPAPYGACQSALVIYDPGLSDPPSLSQAPANSFLHGYGSFAATAFSEYVGSQPVTGTLAVSMTQATADYYDLIDPHDLRDTLGGFQTTNNFDPNTEIHAAFANSADLGFGRDMHCTRTENPPASGEYDVACYVSNYGTGYEPYLGDGLGGGYGSDDEDDFHQAALGGNNYIATVAMEYSRIEDPNDPNQFLSNQRVVKFYVYNAADQLLDGLDSNDQLDPGSAFVDLDGFGGRPLPQLCIVCHGGALNYPGIDPNDFVADTNVPVFNSFADADMGSIFLPFDLHGFTIVDGLVPGFNKADQQQEFRLLNQDIVLETNPGAPIEALINEWYSGGNTQDENVIVPLWQGDAAHEAFYLNVLRPSCRTCHFGQVNAPGPVFESIAEATDAALLNQIRLAVCGNNAVMPHARATYDRFWLSTDPHQPAQLISWGNTYAGGLDWSICGAAPEDPTPIPDLVYHYPTVQEVWDNNCTGCHGAAGGLDLGNNAYDNLVNVPAQTGAGAGQNRVTPGNLNNSHLWERVDAGNGSPILMPQGGPPLGSDDLLRIENWITSGALEQE